MVSLNTRPPALGTESNFWRLGYCELFYEKRHSEQFKIKRIISALKKEAVW